MRKKKLHKPKLFLYERRKRDLRNAKNRQLRIVDDKYSEEMLSANREDDFQRFENLFCDDEACDKRLLGHQGWKEVENREHKRGVVLIFKCDEVFNNKPCTSEEAIKLLRDEGMLPYVGKTRWVYQCKKCGSQFNLYKGTIFNNRKKTDIWIWFLCLYTIENRG